MERIAVRTSPHAPFDSPSLLRSLHPIVHLHCVWFVRQRRRVEQVFQFASRPVGYAYNSDQL